MCHLVIIFAGICWGLIALGIFAFYGLTLEDAAAIAPGYLGVGVVTSYVVSRLFRAHLKLPEARTHYWLPLATIPSGVCIWTFLLFSVSAVQSLVRGFPDLFDGFFAFLIAALLISLSIALPVTYPAAYLTQILLARYTNPQRT